jgi:hypothetical protein
MTHWIGSGGSEPFFQTLEFCVHLDINCGVVTCLAERSRVANDSGLVDRTGRPRLGLGANGSEEVPNRLLPIVIALVLDDRNVRAVLTYSSIVNVGALSHMKIISMTESCRLW